MKYKKNDIIRTTGGCHYVIKSCSGYKIHVDTNGLEELGFRVAKKPKYWIDIYSCPKVVGNITDIKEGENDMTKLYEIKQEGNETLYGTKLAKNSAGQWVMEVKGTGQVITADPNQVEEVLPYTIGVNFKSEGQIYHYISEAGAAEVGDLFVADTPHGRSIVQVTAVNTKSKVATVEFKPLGKLLLDK